MKFLCIFLYVFTTPVNSIDLRLQSLQVVDAKAIFAFIIIYDHCHLLEFGGGRFTLNAIWLMTVLII